MDSTQQALLNQVIATPDDDAPRLIYADWLEENSGELPCNCINGELYGMRKCSDGVMRNAWYPCGVCGGTGQVSNGYLERAELIRVNIEADRWQENNPTERRAKGFHRYRQLRNREIVLCPNSVARRRLFPEFPWTNEVQIRRGFVSEVKCMSSTWNELGEEMMERNSIEIVQLLDVPSILPSVHETGLYTYYYVAGTDLGMFLSMEEAYTAWKNYWEEKYPRVNFKWFIWQAAVAIWGTNLTNMNNDDSFGVSLPIQAPSVL